MTRNGLLIGKCFGQKWMAHQTEKVHDLSERQHRFWFLAGVFLFLLLAVVVLYGRNSFSCEVEAVENASALLLAQMTHYDDVYVSATNGTRESIDYPVKVMQQVLVDTQEIEVPACLRAARGELVDYMRNVVRAFQAFQNEDTDDTVKGFLDESYAHVRVFLSELERVKRCAPYCMP
jgi:hypothetical protein